MRKEGWRAWRRGVASELPGLEPVIGHRGAAARAPENTLAGLRKAHMLGARWVEFDVMLTADQVPVLIHDETLARTTTGRGEVAGVTATEIADLDAGSWFAPEFAGERVPTLEQAVALLLALGMNANVEIKPASGHEVATGEAVADELKRLWPEHGPHLLLSSFEREAVAAARQVAPHLARGLLVGALPKDWAVALEGLACTTLHLDQSRATLGTMSTLTAAGVPTLFYTINDATRARELLSAGARAVFTDLPDVLLASLAAQ